MSEIIIPGTSRRDFIKTTGRVAAASALAGVTLPFVHGQEAVREGGSNIAVIGCGGRGTGAVANALSVTGAPLKLVAMADVSESKLKSSYNGLKSQFAGQMDVPAERQFIGFDAFKKAIDCLKPNDIAIFTTPCAFRWVQFQYAIEKGINVFMEKPLITDGPGARRMYALAEESLKKPMKVAVGLMCRHCTARGELYKRIHNGEIGDITHFRTYRMQGPVASCFSEPKPADKKELLWQIERFHSFLWASGGSFSDYMIHNIDECCWMKDSFPVKAMATGGRHDRGNNVDQNFDHYSVEYIFNDGVRLFMEQRNVTGCQDEFASYVHGTKGMAVISSAGHSPAKCRIFKGQEIKSENLLWKAEQPEPNPYQTEWDDFMAAIRENRPYNEVKRSIEASLTCVMGRMAAHTGQMITWEDALNSDQEFAPNVDKLTLDSDAPLMADAKGRYPVPMPGLNKKHEY
ncbi:MAG: putative dehydrogenase [Chthoniobacteraceae bacterium]|nr:putative dehydrogenase [Chthoniobacteraceae bacterium]